jgi:hypothetical protein
LINAFAYSILIKFIPNHTTCLNNILKHYHVNKLKFCNINKIFDTKTWKIKHWLCVLWLLLMWTHPIDLMCMQFFESRSAMSFSFYFFIISTRFLWGVFFFSHYVFSAETIHYLLFPWWRTNCISWCRLGCIYFIMKETRFMFHVNKFISSHYFPLSCFVGKLTLCYWLMTFTF